MADDPELPANDTKPAPRRRANGKDASSGRKTVKDIDVAVDPVLSPKASKAMKPRSSKRGTPPAHGKKGDKAAKLPLAAAPKKGGGWGAAAIAGGLGAAATLALLSLRSSAPKRGASKPAPARQPDGTDSSASFAAGIADENTMPGDEVFAPLAVNGGAHQPDGTDSSASFEAGIADEGTIPS